MIYEPFEQDKHLFPHGDLLMCAPTYYDIEYEINPWMHIEKKVHSNFPDQWNTLQQLIARLGARVSYIEPEEGLPDMTFAANAGLVFFGENRHMCDKIFIPSNFLFDQRRGEREFFRKHFKKLPNYIVKDIDESVYFEGAGDALWAGKRLFGGFGHRTDIKAYKYISDIIESEVITLELIDKNFYHLDTCFCPLNSHQAIFYPPAFSPEAIHKLEKSLDLFSVSEEDAKRFACNSIVIGNSVIMPAFCFETGEMVSDLKFDVYHVFMSEFIKAGGACKCLTIKV